MDNHANCRLVELDIDGQKIPAVIHENGDVSIGVAQFEGQMMVATVPSDAFDQLAAARWEVLYGGSNTALAA